MNQNITYRIMNQYQYHSIYSNVVNFLFFIAFQRLCGKYLYRSVLFCVYCYMYIK